MRGKKVRLACGMSGSDKYIEEMNTAGEVGREVGVGVGSLPERDV